MIRFSLAAASAVLLMGTLPAAAEEPIPMPSPDTPCAEHAEITAALSRDHAEQPVSRGIDARGVMVEVFAAPAGNWTIVVTEPGGMSCLMAAGEAWELLPRETAGIVH